MTGRNGEGGGGGFGAHVSVAGGVAEAPPRSGRLEAPCQQIFSGSPRRWSSPGISKEEGRAFREACRLAGVRETVVHAKYLINNASPRVDLWERSLASLEEELRRAGMLGAQALVVHPGSATDGDREGGLVRNGRAVARALSRAPAEGRDGPLLCLESTAGAGHALGSRFDELARIRQVALDEAPDLEPRLGVCLDSCHLYASGYDLARDYDTVMAELEEAMDPGLVRVWHLNDSAGALGSRVDRHAHIGHGEVGREGFRHIVRDPRWRECPMIIETPKEDDPTRLDRRNLERLRELRRGSGQ